MQMILNLSIFVPILFVISLVWGFSVNCKKNWSKYAVLITGCDSGFGLATAKVLSTLGFQVICTCLTEEGRSNLTNIAALAVICDVTKENDINNLVASVYKYVESKNLIFWSLINNAGIALIGYVDWMPMDAFRKSMEVNFFAPVRLSKEFLPLLKRTKGSRVINVSSVAGIQAGAFLGPYSATKHALEGVGKAMREEFAGWGVYVCHINPGFMKTSIIETSSDVSFKFFNSAPKEITDHYKVSHIHRLLNTVNFLAENPDKVVSAIVDTVCSSSPNFWNFPGFQAKFMSLFIILPRRFQEFVLSFAYGADNIVKEESIKQFRNI